MITTRQSPGSKLHMPLRFLRVPGFFVLVAHLLSLHAAELESPKSRAGSAGQDPASAMRLFHVAPGLKIDLFAAEPMIQNVVNFTFDEQGRCYVVESHR